MPAREFLLREGSDLKYGGASSEARDRAPPSLSTLEFDRDGADKKRRCRLGRFRSRYQRAPILERRELETRIVRRELVSITARTGRPLRHPETLRRNAARWLKARNVKH